MRYFSFTNRFALFYLNRLYCTKNAFVNQSIHENFQLVNANVFSRNWEKQSNKNKFLFFIPQMNILLISIFAVASLSIFPTKTMGTTDVQPHEEPHALPLSSAPAGAIATQSNAGEIWQEDDREVLIRNERGTKNNSNGSGKKEKVKKLKNANENTKVPESKPPSEFFVFFIFFFNLNLKVYCFTNG